jgi:hypothetical protein
LRASLEMVIEHAPVLSMPKEFVKGGSFNLARCSFCKARELSQQLLLLSDDAALMFGNSFDVVDRRELRVLDHRVDQTEREGPLGIDAYGREQKLASR